MKFKMIKEAYDYWGAKVKKLRDYKNPDINAEIDEMEKATTRKEVYAAEEKAKQKIKSYYDWNSASYDVRGLIFDMEHLIDDYSRYLTKQQDRKAIEAKKAEKTGKKDALAAKIQKAFEHPLLNKALESVGKDFFKAIKDSITETETEKVKKYFTKDKFNIKDPPHPRYQYASWHEDDKGYEKHIKYSKAWEYMKEYFNHKNKKLDVLRPDWKEYIDKKATDYATLIVDRWKNKMALKLGEVIERKGGATVKSTSDDLFHHDLFFKFDDGAAFRVNTQQVWARSKLGNIFTRYPTTFHDVKFKDGKFMKIPSAEKMQDEFGISDFTISEKE